MDKIVSLQNSQIKGVVRLRERKERDETGLFLIEGYRELLRAVDAGWKMEKVFYCPELFLGENETHLIQRCSCEALLCGREAFLKIAYRDRPDGLLAVARQIHRTLSDLESLLSPVPFLVIAESIEKPGNLGTILRSCDAAHVDAMIVCDPTTDVFNPNVVRSSVGTLFTVPVVIASSGEALLTLKRLGISIVASSPHAQELYTEIDMVGPVAIGVGTEQYGLSKEWMQQADKQLRIPMLGTADSLNVASATTLLLYEVLRQRSLLR